MTWNEMLRASISGVILALFAAALLAHPDNALLVGALIAMATSSSNYWFGSTASGAKTVENTSKALDLAHGLTANNGGQAAQETAEAAQKKADQLSGK